MRLLLTIGLLAASCLLTAEDFFLIRDGKSEHRIVLPAKGRQPAVDKYLKQTAEQLRDILRESSGAELPVVWENEIKPGTPGIYIGNTAEFRRQGGNVQDYKGLTNRILIRSGNVFLAGVDHARDTSAWHTYDQVQLGSVRAVVHFLERFAGVEFLMPGPTGTNVPVHKSVKLPAAFDNTEIPRLQMAAGRSNDLFYDCANENFGFGTVFHYRGHSYYAAVPKAKFGKTHPEYYIELDGKRDPSLGHVCISNPEVQELIYREALRRLDAGADTVQVAQTDGYTQCECKSCQAFGGVSDPAEKIWILHRTLAERLKKDRPGKRLQLLAYGPNWNPPETFDTFPGNVIIELCSYSQEDFARWKHIKGIAGFAVYLYNWGEYHVPGLLPKRPPEYLGEQARLFARNKVSGVYRCGAGELYGLEGPGYYVHAQMLRNPELNEFTMARHYVDRVFLEAAEPMQGFYNLLNARLEAYSRLDGNYGGKDKLPGDPRTTVCFLWSPELIAVLEQKLAAAEKLARTPKVKQRLDLVRREFTYAVSLAKTLHFYNAYRLNPDSASFEHLGNAVTAHQTLVNSYYDNKGKAKKIPGWQEIRFLGEMPRSMLMSNGRLRAEIGAPLNWNIPFLRSRKILPGTQKRQLTIGRCSAAPSFDFAAPEWQKVPWQELGHIQLGELKEATRFKVLYDAQNVYFAMESDLPAERKHQPVGHDGQAWLQDSLEILIDPLGTREVSYHFIFNPVADSYYEGARGLIRDPLHPKFGQEDAQWNGKWSYQTRRDGSRWLALVTIPFAAFGQTVPASGTQWTLNVARQSYYSPKMKWQGETGLWSPNLENMFIDRNLEAFGTAVFQ